MDTWLDLGANPAKMSLGLPSYGQTFKLKNPLTDHGLLAEAEGPNDKVRVTIVNVIIITHIQNFGNIFATFLNKNVSKFNLL